MTTLLELTRDLLAEEGWSFEEAEDEPVLRLGFAGESGRWLLYAVADEELSQSVFYSIYPDAVPPGRRLEVAQLVSRINYDLTIGSFDLDMEEGTLRFRTSLDFEGSEPDPTVIRTLALANVATMDQFYRAIGSVVSGTPAEVAYEDSRPDDEDEEDLDDTEN
jgi:hypothetical protein